MIHRPWNPFISRRPVLNLGNRELSIGVESLERRRLLAGNVSVDGNGDNLTLRGDGEDNSVSVFGDNGTVWVSAYGFTTLTGDATSNNTVSTALPDSSSRLAAGLARGACTVHVLRSLTNFVGAHLATEVGRAG